MKCAIFLAIFTKNIWLQDRSSILQIPIQIGFLLKANLWLSWHGQRLAASRPDHHGQQHRRAAAWHDTLEKAPRAGDGVGGALRGMIPARLFQYRRFVEAHFVDLLRTGRVKLSRPDAFNDPWDCRVHYRAPNHPDEIKRVVAELTEWHRKHYPAISEAERKLRADEFISDPKKLEAAIAENERYHYAAICDQYRVYCLTEKPNSPLMWAHYACSHTGVCLEFDTKRAPFTEAFPPFTGGLLKVDYRTTYPSYDIVSGGYRALFTKSVDWSYEAEWRLIAEARGFARSIWTLKTNNDFLTLPSGVLKSVTIGCLTDESSRQQIERLVSTIAPGVLVRHATLVPDRYELRISPPFR
jgi:hypothetical protein